MGTLVRNRVFAHQLLIMVLVCTALTVAAFMVSDKAAAAWCGLAGLVSCLLFSVFSFVRYREIAQLAAQMNEVLHGGRRVSFSDCREGDVAILRAEASKLVSNLARATEHIRNEKGALADALADISHQIRTPLTAMSLLIPVAERADDPEARTRALRELERMMDRISWLVTTLLRLARLDAGALTFERRPVRAADAISRALSPLELSLEVRGINLTVDAADVTFMGDAAWTAEALENIVKNCAEATGSDGQVRVVATENALATHITVSDNGPGIPEEDLPHIFERFYRSKVRQDADELASQGFGIGLALAQALISAQGATLRARNLAQGGASFDIAFPKLIV